MLTKPLSKVLLKRFLLAYIFLVVGISGIQFYIEYNNSRQSTLKVLNELSDTFTPSVAGALWDYQEELLKAVTRGIGNHPKVASVTIFGSNGEKWSEWRVTEGYEADPELTVSRELPRPERAMQGPPLGRLVIASSKQQAGSQLIGSMIKIGFSVVVLLFFLLLTLWLLVGKLLGRPLTTFSDQVTSLTEEKNYRHIVMDSLSVNEIATLQHGFNQLMDEVSAYKHEMEQKVAERTTELEEQKQVFEKLIYESTDAVLLLRDGRVVDCNSAALKLLGLDVREQLLDRGVFELSPEKQPDGMSSKLKAEDVINACLERGSYQFEWVHSGGDGKPFWVEITLTKIELNRTYIIHGIWRDITDRKQAGLELKRSEEEYRSLVAALPDIIMRFDAQGHHLFVSDNVEQVTGIPAKGFIGKTHQELGFPPAMCTFWEHAIEQPFVSKKSYETEFEIDGPIGHIIFNWRLTPDKSEDGSVRSVLAVARDITEKRNTEVELQRRDRYQRAVLDNFPFMVWLKDTESRFLAVNKPFAEACGAELPEELVGKTDLDVWPEALAKSYRADDRDVLSSGMAKSVEEPIQYPDEKRWIETYKSPVLLDDRVIGTVGFARNITNRKKAEEELRQSASVFDHANEGIMITDESGTIMDVNAAFTRITGYTRDEIIGENPRLLQSEKQTQSFYHKMWKKLKNQGYWTGELWNKRKDGLNYAVMLTISAVRNDSGQIQRYISLFSDITRLKEYQVKLEHIAHYDTLTDLPNRSLLADRMHQAMAQAQRYDRQLAVLYLDLDGFKNINDTHGHDRGDLLLKIVAKRMQSALRSGDTLARIGGDEFVAILTEIDSLQASDSIIRRILSYVSEFLDIDGLGLQISASIGVTYFPQSEDAVDGDQLIRQADQAMYVAKQAGKNRYHVFDAIKDQAVRGHHEKVERIREALERNELLLYYQPKVDMYSGDVVGAEALIRWQHPQKGLLTPAFFLPAIANETLSVTVGDWVIETAVTQIETWKQSGITMPVSVNIDGMQFAQTDFIDKLTACLARHPLIEPGDLELEVLETSALEDVARVHEIIMRCDELGIKFALDDFGTGYSTLTHLKRLPAQTLKIDKSFVRDMLNDPEDLAILDGVLGLAEAFQRSAIAEGVETIEHGALLLSLGCRLAQGFGIAKPMPAEFLADWTKEWAPDKRWLHRPRVKKEQLSMLFSMVELRAWVSKLEEYLRDRSSTPPVIKIDQCEFGKWFIREGSELIEDEARLKTINRLHSEMHQSAMRLIEAHQLKQSFDIVSELTGLERQRDKLLSLMDYML
ncbi:MAG: EAL domain-containing protein [Candidatus Thiodiazotropha sp. (ex. Lucinisca nassula)]|nr:EAL domain-containing protein [Candidatus Thiodiazotropha sp. (ex. Lucinisca nassula)]